MAILEETVWITLNGKTIKHYEDLSYKIERKKDSRGRMKVTEGTQIEVRVEDLPRMCNLKLTKICDSCGKHVVKPQPYSAIITARDKGDGKDYCKSCKGISVSSAKLKKLKVEDSLSYKFPDISTEWNTSRNEITPDKISAGSNTSFWWICSKNKNHEWMMSPNSRTSNGQNCPFCSSHRACIENCLATVYPEIAKEWNYEKNGSTTPYDVTYGSGRVVWWLGSRCNHEWESAVYSRTGKDKGGCSICKMSKGEIKIYDFLKQNLFTFEPQQTFKGLVGLGGIPLRFDFAVFNKNKKLDLIIEYDGEFHYEQRYDGDGYETTVIHDGLKNEYCYKNNIKLIRIPYWKFDKIEKILEKELNIRTDNEAS